jgi:hypothetical protein
MRVRTLDKLPIPLNYLFSSDFTGRINSSWPFFANVVISEKHDHMTQS